MKPSLLALSIVLLSGCSAFQAPEDDSVCTYEARPAILVELAAALGEAPVADTVVVIARDGVFSDSAELALWPGARAGLAHERAGIYEVRVERQGQAVWQRSGLRVARSVCHVETVLLEVAL